MPEQPEPMIILVWAVRAGRWTPAGERLPGRRCGPGAQIGRAGGAHSWGRIGC